jgi:myo-inositol-1(or 4)-monophosphatase
VIYDPLRDQLFAAERARGATLNGTPLETSRIVRLDHAIVALDWGHSDRDREKTLGFLGRVAPRCGTVRALGSAALAQAYVAAGSLDAYLSLVAKPWDAAAGLLIATESGATYTTIEGQPYHIGAQSMLVSNGPIHDQLLSTMHTHSATPA